MAGKKSERAALGLPSGSVRALITLLIIVVVAVLIMRNEPVGVLWHQMLMIALAHYFTSRRLINLPRDTLRKLEEDGLLEKEAHPLYLPRHSIRTIVIVTFVVLAAYLVREQRLLGSESLGLLINVFAYFLGMLSKGVVTWLTRNRAPRSAWRWWADAKAVAALTLTGTIAVTHLLGSHDVLPAETDDIAIGVALFYFGSR